MTHEDAIAAILAREQEKGVVTEAELRQQLADVTNERDEARKQREAILMQARVWAGEAKTQRSTVESVGAILGGVSDWGPIAAGVEALKEQLNASEARNSELARYIVKANALLDELGCPLDEVIDLFEAQSEPATVPEFNDPAYNAESDAHNSAELLQEVLDWFDDGVGRSDEEYKLLKKIRGWLNPPEPATDEQGAGS